MSAHATRIRSLGAAIAALLATLPLAQARADDTLVDTVRACAALRSDTERLACFDRKVVPAATGVTASTTSPSQEEMFGMSSGVAGADAEPPPPSADKPESIDEITAQVASLQALARGERVITLDNGQVWQTVDTAELLIKPGDSVTISRAALGTFRLVTSSHRTARVKRVQ